MTDTDTEHTSDSITLDGVPIYPGNEVPDGYRSLIEDIVEKDDAEDRTPQEIADTAGEQAIVSAFREIRSDGDGVREPYKDMLLTIQSQLGRQGIMRVRQAFTDIISQNHSALVEEQEQTDAADTGDNQEPEAPTTNETEPTPPTTN